MTIETIRNKVRAGEYKAPSFGSLKSMSQDIRIRNGYDGEENFKADLAKCIKDELGCTAFRAVRLTDLCWDLGHSSGFEEVLGYAKDIIHAVGKD